DVRCNGSVPWMKAREFIAQGYANAAHGNVAPMILLGSDDAEESVRRFDSDHRLSAVADDWYCLSSRLDPGPYRFATLVDEARCGRLSPEDQIRLGENGPWRRAGSMGRLMAVMPFQRPDLAEDELETTIPLRDAGPTTSPDAAPETNG